MTTKLCHCERLRSNLGALSASVVKSQAAQELFLMSIIRPLSGGSISQTGHGVRGFRSRVAAGIILYALTACAELPPPEAGGSAVVSARDNMAPRFIEFVGARAQHAPPFLGVPQTNFYCLRSFIDRQTGE